MAHGIVNIRNSYIRRPKYNMKPEKLSSSKTDPDNAAISYETETILKYEDPYMGIERITLNFDTDDKNSMILLGIMKEIKRGRRVEVLADSILILLEEHKLLDRFSDNYCAMAKLIEMFSDSFRATTSTTIIEHPSTVTAASEKYKNVKRSKIKRKESSDILQAYHQPVATSSDREEPISPANLPLAGNQYSTAPQETREKKYLTDDQWIRAMNDTAMAYFRLNVPADTFAGVEKAIRMIGDDEDRYEELVIEPGLILNQVAPLPSTEMSFEEWLTEQLNEKGIYKESR